MALYIAKDDAIKMAKDLSIAIAGFSITAMLENISRVLQIIFLIATITLTVLRIRHIVKHKSDSYEKSEN